MIINEYFKTPFWIIEKPEFLTSLNKASNQYIKNAKTLMFEIMSSINRYDFGADGFPFLVGKEIKLNSSIELIRGD